MHDIGDYMGWDIPEEEQEKKEIEAENIILSLASVIYKKRMMEQENMELRRIRDEYYKFVDEQAKLADKRSRAMLNAVIAGVEIGKGEKRNDS